MGRHLVLQQCSELGGGFPSVGCTEFNLNPSGPLRLTLTQNGFSAHGTLELGGIQIGVSGFIGTDQTLRMTGEGSQVASTFTLSDWQTSRNVDTLSGSFALTVTPDNKFIGAIRISAVLLGRDEGLLVTQARKST